MEHPHLPLSGKLLAACTIGGAIMGPWALHNLALHLYPQLRVELRKHAHPENTPLPIFWWIAWLSCSALGNILGESHLAAAAILYILCGWVQVVFLLFITRIYPHGLPQIQPTYRHYMLNECMELWLPGTIALPLLQLAAGCSVSSCMGGALCIPALALLRVFAGRLRHRL